HETGSPANCLILSPVRGPGSAVTVTFSCWASWYFSRMARPFSPLFQTETKMNFVVGFSPTVFSQPPLFNSAWQFEHHGAHKCTTVRSGDLIASRTFCSAGGGSARSDVTAISAIKINKRRADMRC